MRYTLKKEFKRAKKLLGVEQAIFFYGNARSISKEAIKIAFEYLNLKLRIEDILAQIKGYPYGTFRICPISCIQHPVIFFFSPYPIEMLPFLSHSVAHEMLHLKHALFCSSKVPYFVRRADLPCWKKAGYSVFSYEKYFRDLVNSIGMENTHKVVWDYSERIRDFLVNNELLFHPEYAQVTRTWEKSQAYREVSILKSDSMSIDAKYKRRIALLDLSIRLKFLRENEQKEIWGQLGRIPTKKLDYLSCIKKITELFNGIQMPLEPSRFKELVHTLDQIVSLSKAITT
jgi:hypothetical protein